MSRYWATRATIAGLRVEQEVLRRKIDSLTSHNILHNDYCSFVPSPGCHTSELANNARKNLSLSKKMHLDLIIAHCHSLHGEFAENYYELFLEYALLQKLYRRALARSVVTRYQAQRLVITVGRLYYPLSTPVFDFTPRSSRVNLTLLDFARFCNSCCKPKFNISPIVDSTTLTTST